MRIVIWATTFAVALATGAPAAAGADADQPDSRIVGGSTTGIETVPWQVALVLDARFGGNDLQRQFCGGSLIAPQIVQTAAHCVVGGDPDDFGLTSMDTNDLDVVAGRTTLSSSSGQRLNVAGIAVDARYDAGSMAFDAAWLSLTGGPGAPAAPIKIAGPGEASLWAPGTMTFVSGWGTTSEGGSRSDTLRVAITPVIDDPTCDSLGGVYANFSAFSMVCAGVLSGGTDSCSGDSGGPLAAPGFVGSAPVSRLVGAVSFGEGCARPNAPGVYTRIAGPAYNPAAQQAVDRLEAAAGIPDSGSVYGAGATAKAPVEPAAAAAPVKCKKGKRLKKGKCVKKKRKRKRPKK